MIAGGPPDAPVLVTALRYADAEAWANKNGFTRMVLEHGRWVRGEGKEAEYALWVQTAAEVRRWRDAGKANTVLVVAPRRKRPDEISRNVERVADLVHAVKSSGRLQLRKVTMSESEIDLWRS